MLVVFSPIFVADTKITFVYNFVAPLRGKKNRLILNFAEFNKNVEYHHFKKKIAQSTLSTNSLEDLDW